MNGNHIDDETSKPEKAATPEIPGPSEAENRSDAPLEPAPGTAHPKPINVLFLNDGTPYSQLMEHKLTSRGIHVTSVSDHAETEAEWNLGVHDLLIVDHSVPLGVRLLLLETANERARPIPTMMIFEPDANQDAVLASEHGALACVFLDDRKEYLSRIASLVESQARQSFYARTECLPAEGDEDDLDDLDLQALAAEVSGKRAEAAPVYLTILGGPDVGRTVRIDDATCIIGRDSSCHLRLSDEAVSRFHARIKQYTDGITEIRDLDSSNGIYLQGKRVTSAYLKGGDEILIGKNTLIKFQR